MRGEHIRIGLLGTLEVYDLGHPEKERLVHISAAKPRQVLATLAANADTVVTMDQLIDELWPDRPPSTVKTIVQTYVYQLRRTFGEASRSTAGTTILTTRPGGYLLSVPKDNVDIFRFQDLMDRGLAALRLGEHARAAELLRDSLALWRGPVLADLNVGTNLQGLAVYLEEQRLEAVSARIEADLAGDRHGEIVGELRRLVSAHQLHESFHIRLMQALYRCGRRGEALTVYQKLRGVLDHELGLEPSSEAQRLQQEILAGQ
ncbi:DNA-binding transcriptional activator of the SARP family [Micromonospora rifamycinica]|uniref:DNA-binding transcriptional activator of the SARP family n=1 Tax=Micromonospora rifamycinica TaxID=291594 RepID=A0A1C5HMI3_9ACTN|nr:DNA-binding transcriptional activator of the SARP family [Micromonospora rifamycinica]